MRAGGVRVQIFLEQDHVRSDVLGLRPGCPRRRPVRGLWLLHRSEARLHAREDAERHEPHRNGGEPDLAERLFSDRPQRTVETLRLAGVEGGGGIDKQ